MFDKHSYIKQMAHSTLTGWFKNQVQKTPDNIAVEIKGQFLTYSELDERSNYVGWALLNSGVKKEEIVAVMTERSIETVIGLLGVLKAGAAFLAIDISNPLERIRFVLQDSGAKAVLTNTWKYDYVKENFPIEVYAINIANTRKEPTGITRQPTDLAYAIYTSGTTGAPKGALNEDVGLVNYIYEHVKDKSYDNGSVMLQKATCSFDASLFEIFSTLLSGGKLQLLTEQENESFFDTLRVIKDNNVTHLGMIPTILSALLDYMESSNQQSSFSNIRKLYIGGEELTVPLLEKYSRVTGADCSYISNAYGPSECSIGATEYDVGSETLDKSSPVPIGKPLNGISIYIMNDGKLCDVGEEGELYIGGIAVGRGYINRPELTAEKFIQNPICANERIYRSGDLAKWNENGNIIFLGRIDEQVKLNGLRIELTEIKNRLLEYPGVIDAAVVLKNEPDRKYLIGYLVSKNQDDEDQIKEHLRQFLPDYMIPLQYIYLDKLPFTKNGKLDKNALPNSTPRYIKDSSYSMIEAAEEVEV